MEDIEKINKPLLEGEAIKSNIEIKYKPAPLFNRFMSYLFDFIIFLLVLVSCFIVARNQVTKSKFYKTNLSIYTFEEISSGLYVENSSGYNSTVIDYIDEIADFTQAGKHNKSKKAVETFYSYAYNSFSNDEVAHVKETILSFLTSADLVNQENIKYILDVSFSNEFILITENQDDSVSSNDLYSYVYKPLINDYLLSLFASYSVQYKEALTKVSNLLVFVALPISYAIAVFLVYLLPPLILRRNRQTLGKLLFKIGLVGPDYLSVKSFRFLLNFLIFFFLEFTLSIFSCLVPLAISFSVMIFSKTKQNFHQYLTKIREIDISTSKIYKSIEEINLLDINPHKKAIDFKRIEEV